MIIELKEDKYGEAMKAVSCMEEKLHILKEILEQPSVDYRRPHREYDPYYREERNSYRDREYNRYM